MRRLPEVSVFWVDRISGNIDTDWAGFEGIFKIGILTNEEKHSERLMTSTTQKV
jgi:hypothetical protein